MDECDSRIQEAGCKTMTDPARLKTTVEGFCRFVEGLPKAAGIEQDWGPKEVLAHLVFWHESYVAQIEALLVGAPFELPQGRFSDLNAQAAAANHDVPIAKLVRRFRAADKRLRALCAAHDPAAIVLEIKQGSKRWRLVDLVPAVEAHVRNHHRQLERR
jgi:hypothetical protein